MSINLVRCGDVFRLRNDDLCVVVYAGRKSFAECEVLPGVTEYLAILVVPVVSRDVYREDTDVLAPIEACGKKLAVRCDMIHSVDKSELLQKIDRLLVHEIKEMREGVRLVMEL